METDALRSWIDKVAKVPLLTRQEEIALAKRVEAGDKLARERMVERNLRLVIHIAKKHQNRGLELDDLINEGSIGLMRAVDKYDYTKSKFSTYAFIWIEQSVKRAVENYGRTIRNPVHYHQDAGKLEAATRRLEIELGYPPLLEDVIEQTGFSADRIKEIREYKKTTAARITSLDMPVGNEEGAATLGEIIPDDEQDFAKNVIDEQFAEEVRAHLHVLTDDERTVIEAVFGINRPTERAIDLREKLGKSKSGITATKARALRVLREYLEGNISPEQAQKRKKESQKRMDKLAIYEERQEAKVEALAQKEREEQDQAGTKVCPRCHSKKPVVEFASRTYRSGKKGWQPYCKDPCKKEIDLKYSAAKVAKKAAKKRMERAGESVRGELVA